MVSNAVTVLPFEWQRRIIDDFSSTAPSLRTEASISSPNFGGVPVRSWEIRGGSHSPVGLWLTSVANSVGVPISSSSNSLRLANP